jgi:hypothetical protein
MSGTQRNRNMRCQSKFIRRKRTKFIKCKRRVLQEVVFSSMTEVKSLEHDCGIVNKDANMVYS